MSKENLAEAIQAFVDRMRGHDEFIEIQDFYYFRDIKELLCVLRRIVSGSPILKAFGAPGDWGYNTEIGKSLHRALQEAATQHPDDAAVDRFAAAMKEKLARAREKGRSGWDDPTRCSDEFLAEQLVAHLDKGNVGTFEDLANFCMFLHQRKADPGVFTQIGVRLKVGV